jgi:hypothetical protein
VEKTYFPAISYFPHYLRLLVGRSEVSYDDFNDFYIMHSSLHDKLDSFYPNIEWTDKRKDSFLTKIWVELPSRLKDMYRNDNNPKKKSSQYQKLKSRLKLTNKPRESADSSQENTISSEEMVALSNQVVDQSSDNQPPDTDTDPDPEPELEPVVDSDIVASPSKKHPKKRYATRRDSSRIRSDHALLKY